MLQINDPVVVIEGDNCYSETVNWISEDGKTYSLEKRLVMTKEVFIKCYKNWIEGSQE